MSCHFYIVLEPFLFLSSLFVPFFFFLFFFLSPLSFHQDAHSRPRLHGPRLQIPPRAPDGLPELLVDDRPRPVQRSEPRLDGINRRGASLEVDLPAYPRLHDDVLRPLERHQIGGRDLVFGGVLARIVDVRRLPAQDVFSCGDLVGPQHAAGTRELGVDEGRALLVQRAHLYSADGLVVGPEVDTDEDGGPQPDGEGTLHEAHEYAAGQHAEEADDGLLAPVFGVELGEVAGAGEVRTQTRLCRGAGDAAQRTQHARGAERCHLAGVRERGGQHVEEHGRVVEDVGEEAVVLALWLDGLAEPVGE